MTDLKEKIIQTLVLGEIKMIPKWRLLLYSFAVILSVIFLFLLVIFSLSFIFFILSRYGFMYLPMFGFMTTLHILNAVPLFLLVCTAALLFVVEVISRKYAFGFRRPLSITLLASTSVAVALSLLVSITPMHEYMRDYAQENNMTLVSKVYKRPMSFEGGKGATVLRGVVIATSSDFVIVRLFDGVEIKAYASSSLDELTLPKENSDVLLFGNFINTVFEFTAIKNAPRIPFEKRKRDMRGPEKKKLSPEDEINMFRER